MDDLSVGYAMFFNSKSLERSIVMSINLILFKVYIESFSKWSNVKISADNYETILDIGYWRFYFS